MIINLSIKIGVLGAGTMGAGIAQVAAQSGHEVVLVDVNQVQLDKAKLSLVKILDRMIEKGNLDESGKNNLLNRLQFSTQMTDFRGTGLVIEAIVEKLEIKHAVFKEIE